jgi:arylsulfatase A-like enzyme
MPRGLALAIALSLVVLASTPATAQREEASPAARLDEDAATANPAAPSPVAVPASFPAPPSAASDTPPDIIVVTVDDLGYLPDDRVLERLPNIRRLWLDDGLRLTSMYDQTPLCSPSRASMLTGKNTLDHGVVRNDPRPLDDSETIAVALQEAGYHTALAGKYLNHYDGSTVPPGWDEAFILRSEARASFWDDGAVVRHPGRFSDDITRQAAVRQVNRAPLDEPLFTWASPGAPHVCEAEAEQCYEPEVMARDEGAEACAALTPARPPSYTIRTNPREAREMPPWPRGWRLRRVCESLLVVDRMVGQLVDAQAERGRPALFLFLSDNGMSWGQHGFTLKHTPPSTRAPFYVAGTGIAPGSSDVLLSKIDIAPTLADVADAALPWAAGRSFLPLLEGDGFGGSAELLEVMPGSREEGYQGWNAIRTPSHRLVRWDDGQRELYDLAADPWERQDLLAAEPELATQMEARLDALLGGATPALATP